MADIIMFPQRRLCDEETPDAIDLATAVDVAIRDLRDILAKWGEESSRRQAEECRRMLEQAYEASVY